MTIGFPDSVRQDYLKRNGITEMRPGTRSAQGGSCGGTDLAYYLLRKPVQVFYESVLFRWPFIH